MTTFDLADIARLRRAGTRVGIASICTAHPLAVEAALLQARHDGAPALIEATCNQVNQDGGYTGMTPEDFRAFVEAIADRVGFDPANLVLGGDHLGPNPWRALPAEDAMARAEAMIAAYAAAGFSKLHLDTSMGCRGEAPALADAVTASRAARLAGAAERAARDAGRPPPVYVIGTEVPVPGGATHALDHLEVTRPEAALATVEVHRQSFAAAGLDDAFARAVGVVVQPGVEFADADVIPYDPAAARALAATLERMPQFVFEAHSTDYQPAAALRALVDDGFAILKVGPGLTFAMREALYGLDHVAEVLAPAGEDEGLRAAMERLMVAEPGHWQRYYGGQGAALAAQRHFSYSDRIRYYWPHPEARAAVDALMARLGDRAIPETLIGQYLPRLYDGVRDGAVRPRARDLVIAAIRLALQPYSAACSA
ncbi:D-tagatose-bisphosphate aldolase, class II, non-catalytic subunit [Lichenibacterium dinghuense]|uniref:D-tagatose-bisphosphate aldolase, class II, non-catalytic subunit n=1 Tax=Lichenibacterium dinghuense TaxID=2895977 RepID=UPI001EFF869A|nr:D-tagatose-bisphosphate aldolase, class II, non-catalytic subunit [Lichenibacterium sp. 6Y81]